MSGSDLLDTQVIEQHKPVKRIRRWWRGIHPDKGVVTLGWTGWETVEEKDIIPVHVIHVKEAPPL